MGEGKMKEFPRGARALCGLGTQELQGLAGSERRRGFLLLRPANNKYEEEEDEDEEDEGPPGM